MNSLGQLLGLLVLYKMMRHRTTTDPPQNDRDNSEAITVTRTPIDYSQNESEDAIFVDDDIHDQNIYISQKVNLALYAVDAVLFVLVLSVVIILLPLYIPLKIYFLWKRNQQTNLRFGTNF